MLKYFKERLVSHFLNYDTHTHIDDKYSLLDMIYYMKSLITGKPQHIIK